MNLYTFIMEFQGGIYISQVNENSVELACLEWINNLEISEIENFEESDRTDFIEEIKTDKPTKIEKVLNVWCLSFLAQKNNLALVNIIQTNNVTNKQLTTDN